MISFMFLVMVRVSDPLDAARHVRRAEYAALLSVRRDYITVEGFPKWLRWISYIDPFSYSMIRLKALLLKGTGFAGIYSDVFILIGFSVVLMSLSVLFFKRQI